MQAKFVSYNGMSYIISRKKVCFASVSMQLKQDGIIYVTAPILMPQFMLSKILKSKEEWFRKQIAQYALQRKEKKTYQSGEMVLYLGKEYPIQKHVSYDHLVTKIEFKDNTFHLYVHAGHAKLKQQELIQKALQRWLMSEGKVYLINRADYFSGRMHMEYKSLALKSVSSIWGSCSRDQKLTFNWKLILTPPEIIDYVVAHEISHLKHKHHQKSFWDQVELFDPDHKKHRAWLRKNSSNITIE
jgi:predicted metal-dependent hydrolase